MSFKATTRRVLNRGETPVSFLGPLLEWAKGADDAIFGPNNSVLEIFTIIKPTLATLVGHDPSGTPIYRWDSLLHRKAAALEGARVHAMFESSGNWREGVDRNNATSMAHKTGEEAGAWQVSFDSEWLAGSYMKDFAIKHDIQTPEKFISAMKSNPALACEYYLRLVRVNILWAGPLIPQHGGSSKITPWLSRESMVEFQALLTT